MTFAVEFEEQEPTRQAVDQWRGSLLLEFGTDWCPHCRRAQRLIAAALAAAPEVRHLKIMDGPGRLLGRSFRVKLWPTLVLMGDGQELARWVRPASTPDFRAALSSVSAPSVRQLGPA
ncbi:MAG TPA: thioredoxin family protein [Nevskiaceae bacterium]|nr:thioredoxin family protein [Nevskiaceae bacterium]